MNHVLRRLPLAALAAVVSVTLVTGCDSRLSNVTAVQRSPNSGLAALVTSAGTLNPAFNPALFAYNVVVDVNTPTITVTPTQAENGETITVNGFLTKSGQPSEPISLQTGINTVSIVTTGSDGTTTRTYTISVTRTG